MAGRTSMDVYWNGLNNRGMKVAPGVYRAVIYLVYSPLSGIRDVKAVQKIGVSR